MDEKLPGKSLDWQQITTVEFQTVGRNRIDLNGCVGRPDVSPGRRVPGTAEIDTNHFLVAAGPFALDPKNPITEIECEVISLVFGNRTQHRNSELDGLCGNRSFGDGALPITVQLSLHEHMFAARLSRIKTGM
jgi:hypothetical protein